MGPAFKITLDKIYFYASIYIVLIDALFLSILKILKRRGGSKNV